MEIKKYAPVIIATLNRYDHFYQCLESLEKCIGAENTDVYIGLDYPPSERYVEGWKKINEYLMLKEKHNLFGKLEVHRRDHNCGLDNPNSNWNLLYSFIKHKYDMYIVSEDDNVFSKNFLLFINKGLEKFRDDPKVLAICGYRFYYPLRFKNNNYFRQGIDYNCWGCGCWVDKMELSYKWNYKTLSFKFLNPVNIIKVWITGSYRMNCLLGRTYKKGFNYHDNFYSIYMILNNMHMIMPAVSKVRNIGWDGSGLNCLGYSKEVIDSHLNQEIDTNDHFDYEGTGWELYEENRKVIIESDYNKGNFSQTLVMVIYKYSTFIGGGYVARFIRYIYRKVKRKCN